ncbi:sugar phosphate isomerase/epimerase [Halostella sp. JP-L12]|uniref:sugar phosphate isomerase/epimerase family protein n=1 Tax=Halostella TaxID=1843185 RepID=UPI000EF851A0|nr:MULTISPECIES: sugar phosphate isomerase/epimerase family protein [Halostella]NHN49054.1 sugar phosphate isomerase/epimerase [Halostella sp. JP-L12]
MNVRRGFVSQVGMGEELFDRAAAAGYDHVELMLDGDWSREALETAPERVADPLDEHGLDLLVHLPFGGFDVGSPHPKVREGSVAELAACIETAGELGAEKAVLHAESTAWKPVVGDDERIDLVVDSVRELIDVADDAGVEICAENIPRATPSIHQFDRLFEETEVSMTVDTGHARMDGVDAGGVASMVRERPERISHFHLNDTRVADDEHLPFGAGTIDFGRIFEALRGVGWEGTLSLEVFTLDYGYVAESLDRLDALL